MSLGKLCGEFCRSTLIAAVLILGSSSGGFAALAFYDFQGPCVSGQGDGCNAFGLVDGDVVTGTLAFGETLAVPNERLILHSIINPSPVVFDFAFVFGNFIVSEADVLGFLGSGLEVFFLPPDAGELNALSGFIPHHPVLTIGSRFLLLGPTGLVIAVQALPLGGQFEAHASGSWLRRESIPEPIPEPSALALLATGLAGLSAATWRRQRYR